MSAANKLQQLAKKLGVASRPRSQAASVVARTSQTTLSATENATVRRPPSLLLSKERRARRFFD
jgi:hypothetical protein